MSGCQIRSENLWRSTTHTRSAPHVGAQDLARLFAGTLGDRFSVKHDMAYWSSVTDAQADNTISIESTREQHDGNAG
jgi:hypothetical protein